MKQKRLLSTRLFSVEQRVFSRAGGPDVVRDVVVHPGAVVILPVLDDGRIVLIRNYRYTVERELLELPAGTCEADESPIETARRELIEETGYRATHLAPLMTFLTSPGILTETMHAFMATGLEHVGQNLEDGEQISVEVMAEQDLRQMIRECRFGDGKTIAVLGTYFARLGADAVD